MSTRSTGDIGEQVAATYVESLGYQIRERNARLGRFELDIIAYDPQEKMIVFIEVKTRRTHNDQYPIHTAVGHAKRSSLRRAIDRWIIKHEYEGAGRIDVLSVSGGKVVQHLKDIGAVFF